MPANAEGTISTAKIDIYLTEFFRQSYLGLFPGGEFGIPTDRDQRNWVFLNAPKILCH